MHNKLHRFLIIPAAGILFCGLALAQQSSAPSTQQPSAAKPATTPKTEKAPVAPAPKPLTLETQKDKASYAIGMNVGRNLSEGLKRDAVDIDPELVAQGVKDAMSGSKPLLNDEEMKAVLTTLQNDVKQHQLEVLQKNKAAGEAFLAANKAKPDVVTLPSGLQYKVIQNGDGPKPTTADTVICNYRGTLIDGTEFDSSYKTNKPATFPVTRVIKGWTEALQLMPVGSKWELYIPSNLAYGERGNGPIGPNQALIFELELVSIQPKPGPKLETVPPSGQPQAQPQSQPHAQPQTPPASKP